MFRTLTITTALILIAAIGLSAQPAPDVRGLGKGDCMVPQAPRFDGQGPHGMGMGTCEPGQRGRGQQGPNLLMLADKLELTETQITQLKELRMEHQLAMVDFQAAARKAGMEARFLANDENSRESEVLVAIDRAAEARAEVQKARYMHRKQMHDILTEAQLEKLKELRQDRPMMGRDDAPRAGRGRRSGR